MSPSPSPNRVREARELLGRTAQSVADEAGITVKHYRAIETGTAAPTIPTARRIAAALGAKSIDRLFPADDVPEEAVQRGAEALAENRRRRNPRAVVEVEEVP